MFDSITWSLHGQANLLQLIMRMMYPPRGIPAKSMGRKFAWNSLYQHTETHLYEKCHTEHSWVRSQTSKITFLDDDGVDSSLSINSLILMFFMEFLDLGSNFQRNKPCWFLITMKCNLLEKSINKIWQSWR